MVLVYNFQNYVLTFITVSSDYFRLMGKMFRCVPHMRIQVFYDLWAVPNVLKENTGLVYTLWWGKKYLWNGNILYSTCLPAQQNKGPEQLPSSNICVGRIILVLKAFNLPCRTYYNKIFPRLPTSQQNTKTFQCSRRNKPLTLRPTYALDVSAIWIDIVYLHRSSDPQIIQHRSDPWFVIDRGCGCCFT
jgi:hypothetical protein